MSDTPNAFTGYVIHGTTPFSETQGYLDPTWSKYRTRARDCAKTPSWEVYRDQEAAKAARKSVSKAPSGHARLELGPLSVGGAEAYRQRMAKARKNGS
jgi:hypothetical protein